MEIRQRNQARRKLAEGGVRDRITGCLLWTGGTNGAGYGACWIDGRSVLVHKLSYLLNCGKVDRRNVVAHKCDNTLCFEPTHLEQKSQSANLTDAILRNRMPGLVLDVDKVRQIRAAQGSRTAKDVALSYGISSRMVYRIWRREAWKFV